MMSTRERKSHSNHMTSHMMRKMEDCDLNPHFVVGNHLYRSGASCSKLTASLVNVPLKFLT